MSIKKGSRGSLTPNSCIKMTSLLPAPPATKLKPTILPESGHLRRTTFFTCHHNVMEPIWEWNGNTYMT